MATEILEPTAEPGLPPRPSRRRVVLGVAALVIVAAALVPELLTDTTPSAAPPATPRLETVRPTASPALSATPSPSASTDSAFVPPPSTSPEPATTPDVNADASTESTLAATPATVPAPDEPLVLGLTPEPPSQDILRVPVAAEDGDATALTDEQVRSIYDALVIAAYGLGSYPDPARVADVYAESCPCFEEFLATVVEYRQKGWHTVQTPPTVLEFDVLRREADHFTVRALRQRLEARTLDTQGNVVEEAGMAPPDTVIVTAVRGESLWRIADLAFEADAAHPAAG